MVRVPDIETTGKSDRAAIQTATKTSGNAPPGPRVPRIPSAFIGQPGQRRITRVMMHVIAHAGVVRVHQWQIERSSHTKRHGRQKNPMCVNQIQIERFELQEFTRARWQGHPVLRLRSVWDRPNAQHTRFCVLSRNLWRNDRDLVVQVPQGRGQATQRGHNPIDLWLPGVGEHADLQRSICEVGLEASQNASSIPEPDNPSDEV
jgi:hypothetical protein